MEFYADMKKNEILSFVAKWVEIDKYQMLSLICGNQKK
jgi:septum formation topological specificity factor MinE